MDPLLDQALQPVLDDVATTPAPVPRIERAEESSDRGQASAMLWGSDGTGSGVTIDRSATSTENVAWAADQVQSWVIEELWAAGRSTNWPECPQHPTAHPLTPGLVGGSAVWICPITDEVIALIGALT